jgi:thiamine-phosphate pyrophosphorylase
VAGERLAAGALLDLVPDLAAAGVDLFQLREKDREAGDVLEVAGPLLDACRSAEVPFILNDRPDVARVLGTDGVHVGQNDLPPAAARDIVGSDAIVGLSTHAEAEVDGALQEDIDYFAVGPVHETPTKLGRPAAGLGLVRYAASKAPKVPWFAIGGIDMFNVGDVMAAGARRIVVVRAITEAADPVGAVGELRRALDAVPLD